LDIVVFGAGDDRAGGGWSLCAGQLVVPDPAGQVAIDPAAAFAICWERERKL